MYTVYTNRVYGVYLDGTWGTPVELWIWDRLEGKTCGIPHLAKNERDVGHPAIGYWIELKSASGLARRLGMRILLSRFFWPGLRRVLLRSRALLAFLRDRTLHLRGWMLHLLDRSLDLRGGPLLGSRARRLLPGWCWVRLGDRPYLLDRSGMCLHRLDRALRLVWP
jgi:hypothetical protein